MFLKTLTLKGFKSFAEATSLDMEPGVTVVVGPNGSGKSNVVDAVGWVLGAQAPSAVRSQKMDDVIFAGTAKRPALGRAEVSLTIDNAAGLLPIDLTEVTITRTLFRSGDSEYAINGVPCRLLDIQELLSDSGVGRQQHVIISQGQIDAVLNARPEDRRLVIEEAAGVLKFRRRKEKAERRLAATEGNLTRLSDLLREVRRQLRPLERQADAARRHGAVVGELTALRVHLAGKDLARLRARLAEAEHARQELAGEERATRADLAHLDTEVLATEARLSAMGGDDLGDALVRFESLREKGRGLASLLAERRRGIERDRGASVDAAVIASLEAEAARLAAEVAEVGAEAEALAPEAERLAADEEALAAARARYSSDWEGVEPAAPGGRVVEVRGELGALRSGVERDGAEVGRLRSRLAALDEKAGRLAAEAEHLAADRAAAEAARDPLAARLAGATEARAAAEQRLAAAEEARRSADAAHHTWVARVDALTLTLDQARARAGCDRLAAVAGVLGSLLDVVDIDAGFEAAFEAAAGDALAAVVVEGPDVARRAISALLDGDAAGAVLPLPDEPTSSVPMTGLRAHVRGTRPGVDALLDRLVGATALVDAWPEALDVIGADPAAAVVTRAGDRFGPTGWRVGAVGAGATGAALTEARAQAELATVAAARAEQQVAAARQAVDGSRRVETEAQRSVDANDAAVHALVDAVARVEAEKGEGGAEADTLRAHLADLEHRVAGEADRLAELEAALPGLEAAEADAAAQSRAVAEARSRLEEQAATVGSRRRDLELRSAGLAERRQFLDRRRAEVEERLSNHVAERRSAEARRVELDQRALATDRLSALVASRLAVVEAEVASLRERRRRQSEAAREVAAGLDALRRRRSAAEQALMEGRERLQRAELTETETTLRIEAAVEALRRDLDTEPEAAMAATLPEGFDHPSPVGRVRELERELRLMGPINPLALEEHTALVERHDFLSGQLEDVKSSRRDLGRVIRSIDAEIVNVFAAAYADVAVNFERLFETLFPGGKGSLRLTNPEDLLGTGIELEAKPSGKNVKKLSLLSGGERSLTALAYLFAVFRARPSPFYVMDEVEAALDDVNLHRFLELVHEFRSEAQLIIVTHQKRTMEAADCLYGVTMAPGGSSQVVSERVTSPIG